MKWTKEHHAEYSRKRYDEAVRAGLCPLCRKNPAKNKEYKTCAECIRKGVERSKKSDEKRRLEKVCTRCGLVPPRKHYQTCDECAQKNVVMLRAHRGRDPDELVSTRMLRDGETVTMTRKERYQNWVLRKLYGITLERKREMEVEQGGLCAICENKPGVKGFCVDHIKGTKIVRGLLCTRCNPGLGNYQDSPHLLRRAADYLERTTPKDGVL